MLKKLLVFVLLINIVLNQESKNAIKDSCLNPILLVSTIDGRIHGIEVDDTNENLNVLWTLDTERLISSSIDKLELYNNDNSLMRIIPSLDGNLFAYYFGDNGEHLEKIPYNMDDLLKTSIKLNDKVTVIGGILTQTLGIDSTNGQVVYNCSSNGCDASHLTTTKINDNNDDSSINSLIVIKQSKYLLRAISIENGFEKWNISLIKNEIIYYPTCNRNLDRNDNKFDQTYDRRFNLERIDHIKNQLRFNVSKGVLKYRLTMPSIKKNRNYNLINLNSPIATCDLIYNGILKSINIFLKQQPINKEHLLNNELIEANRKNSNKIQPTSATSIPKATSYYIGKYNTQLYAQSIQIDDDYDDLKRNDYRLLFENSKDLLLKRKSTSNNLPIIRKNSNNKFYNSKKDQQNSLALFRQYDYDMLLSHVARDEDDDNDYNHGIDEKDRFNPIAYDDMFFIEQEIIDYTHVGLLMSLLFTLPVIVIVVVITLYWIKRYKSTKLVTKPVANVTEQVQISPPTNFTNQNSNKINSSSDFGKSANSIGINFYKKSCGDFENESDENNEDESYKSRYLSEFDHIRLIGKGGFGHVFEAKHKIDERVFAIKRIRLKNQKDAEEKVLREIRTLAKLESPYIVRYFHSWFESHPYKWQKKIDKEKLLNNFDDDDCIGGTTTQLTDTNSNTQTNNTATTTTTTTRQRKKYSKINSNSFSYTNDTSSHSIIFENTNEDKSIISDKIDEELEEDEDDEIVFVNENTGNGNDDDDDDDIKLIKPQKQCKELAFYIYIQMELCQRETLRHWLDRFQFENRGHLQIFTIFEQILKAISYIHSQDLIHRDLKPSNIFLSLDGKMIKIGDFGLVVSAEQQIDDEDDNKKKLHKSNDGTYLYMSPEQLKGADYDYKVDIYSIGIILFELIVSFSTQMERIDALKKLNKQKFPDNFEYNYPNEEKLISLLINEDPTKRPTSDELLKHKLYYSFKEDYAPASY